MTDQPTVEALSRCLVLTVVSLYAPTNPRGKAKSDQDQKTRHKDTFYRQ